MTRAEAIADCAGGIPFTAKMAQKTHDGEKTHTMRVMKTEGGNPIGVFIPELGYALGGRVVGDINDNDKNPFGFTTGVGIIRPRYKLGEIYYVQEPWRNLCIESLQGYIYQADVDLGNALDLVEAWNSANTMPPEAARRFIRITGVKAKRAMELNDVELAFEGIRCPLGEGAGCYLCEWRHPTGDCAALHQGWRDMFRSIYPPEKYGENPWCWGYTYERIMLDE